MGKYRTIVADPPWRVHQPPMRYETGVAPPKGEPNRSLPYESMMVEEIGALPVGSLAADDAHLYIWTINRYVEAAYDVARAWGFNPSTLLTWCKAPMGLGVGGAYSLTTEFCLFARRGRGAFERRHDSTWFNWPRGRHSAKPEAFLDLVEQVSPGPYCELFARRDRLGWDTFGDQSLGTAELPNFGPQPQRTPNVAESRSESGAEDPPSSQPYSRTQAEVPADHPLAKSAETEGPTSTERAA